MVTISSCRNKRDLKLFERIPETIHKQVPYFVPPFPGSVTKIFSPRSPYQRHGELIPFIAWKDGQPVGRIAACVNRAHNEHYRDKTGFFGFFDFVDDVEVAKALLDRAKEELRKRGFDKLRGPYNPTVNDEVGLLTEGFESIPFVMMTYNPSYYVEIYEKIGLSRARELFAFYIPAALEAPERLMKIVERVKKSTGLELRSLKLKELDEELKIIHYLYNRTLDRNWGFVPITLEDLQFAAADLKAIVNPELIMIAEKNGQPAGFSMVIPNINEILWKIKGSPRWLRVLRFLWHLKVSHPKEARLAVLGVLPEYRNTGIGALFYVESLLKGKRKYIGGELSWVEETNEEIIKGITLMGAKRYKSYRLYENAIGGTG